MDPEFQKESSHIKRAIPKSYPYDPKALKPLARTLWSTNVALGHALTAYRQFTKIKSASISPDGNLGGAGYIQPIEKIRQKLFQACEILSSISDTVDDEMKGPHWKPKLGALDEDDREDVTRILEDAQEIMEDPASEAEEDLENIEEEGETFTPKTAGVSTSIPTSNLGGPRVDSIGPAAGDGPGGSFNPPEDFSDSDWPTGLRGPDYDVIATSTLPSDPRRTEGYDFGLGWGASGQGVEVGPPSVNDGYWGEETDSSVLPQDVFKPAPRSDLSEFDEEGLDPHSSKIPDGQNRPMDYDFSMPGESVKYVDQNTKYKKRPSFPSDES